MISWCSFLSAFAAAPFSRAAVRKPNIIILLADDMGYHDLGIQGSIEMPTPNIDSIAKNGVRCTSGYVSGPYCSPHALGLMTARYQTRYGHEFNEGPGPMKFGLPLTETTIAQRLKDLGYATYAVGKWHLGNDLEYRPMKRGFDEFYGTVANTSFYHPPQFVDSRVGPEAKRVETRRSTPPALTPNASRRSSSRTRTGRSSSTWPGTRSTPFAGPQETLDRFKNARSEGAYRPPLPPNWTGCRQVS
jgi:arylsulfatase A-like enzyme